MSFDYIFDNLNMIRQSVSDACAQCGRNENEIIIEGVTKKVAPDAINYAVEHGITVIGENRVQEFCEKANLILPCKRHIIGHLQTNKVKDVVGRVDMIESVDSIKLASEIDAYSKKLGINTDVLVQVNIGNDPSKFGVHPGEVLDFIDNVINFSSISVKGFMTILPVTDDIVKKIKLFDDMYNMFIDIRSKKSDNISVEYLSMGMSADYTLAIKSGANIIRTGSALFGQRK